LKVAPVFFKSLRKRFVLVHQSHPAVAFRHHTDEANLSECDSEENKVPEVRRYKQDYKLSPDKAVLILRRGDETEVSEADSMRLSEATFRR
jgi:hypothetical protein